MLCARALAALEAESTVTVQGPPSDDDASSSPSSTESTAEQPTSGPSPAANYVVCHTLWKHVAAGRRGMKSVT